MTRHLLAAAVGLLCLTFRADADTCTQRCKADTWTCIAERCAGLRGSDARECRDTCRGLGGCASIRTLAYVVTECRTDTRGSALHQTLEIRRGNCPPVTVMELPFGTPVHDPIGICRLYGDAGFGVASTLAGAFQRLTVTPGGSGVIFEVIDDVTLVAQLLGSPLIRTPPEVEGMYYVHADGTGLRRIGPASRLPRWLAIPAPDGPLLGFRPYVNDEIALAPSGRIIAYSDIGPGPDQEEAAQVFTLDIDTGASTQVTHLPSPSVPSGLGNADFQLGGFLDRDTVVFSSTVDLPGEAPRAAGVLRTFVVKTDGSGLRVLPVPVPIPGATIDPRFGIAGSGPRVVDNVSLPDGSVELFLRSRDGNLLQLTNFHEADLAAEPTGPIGRRIYFITSGDPLGKNPSHNCQLFSINDLAGGLRQLTRFHEVEDATSGCNFTLPRSGCAVATNFRDPVTGEIVFYSTCVPFGGNAINGALFSIRPNGRGLRQLTATRGLVIGPDSVTAELPGPFWYSTGRAGLRRP